MTKSLKTGGFTSVAIAAMLMAAPVLAQENAGENEASTDLPFTVTEVASFTVPWALTFMPDGRMLVTQKPGGLYIVTEEGEKQEVAGAPEVLFEGQNGMLDVALAPSFAEDQGVYLTYVEPGGEGGGLALARATLTEGEGSAELTDFNVIWRQEPIGGGGQPGGIIAFSPDGQYLFLTSGDRMRPERVQDPDQTPGKVLRLNLDGSVPEDNPMAAEGGVPAQTWTIGHRNPYGLAFDSEGRLWEHEMGPAGGDELNLIESGKNYGWPDVSFGDNYDGTPIPKPETEPDFALPALYWAPVIAPAGLVFYDGEMFPDWNGSALIGGLRAQSLVRVAFDEDGTPTEADRWAMDRRIRDVAVAPDGAIWVIEDADNGALLRLSPTE